MSISIDKVTVVKPKGFFNDEIVFDIEFECTSPISDYIKWEVTYCGSAISHDYDQILTTAFVGPIEVGMNRFVLVAKPPKIEQIPFDELVLSVIMLSAYYKDQEFIRIGHFVSNDIPQEAQSVDQLDVSTIERSFDVEKPTVHISQINWK